MLHQWLRVLKDEDFSLDNQNDSTQLQVLDSTDYVYIGQYFPFNNLFFWNHTPNNEDANLIIEYWDNKNWIPVVDLLDGTSVNGKTMNQSGVVQFSPNKKNGWMPVVDTSEVAGSVPVELNGFTIYDCYWLRIKTSADLTAGAKLNKIAYSFTTSQQLNKLDIEINNFLSAFESGKTDWTKEILTASEIMLNDLKSKGLVVNRGQILRFDDVTLACDCKALALIYSNLGRAYEEKRVLKETEYEKLINLRRFTFDTDNNALVSSNEISFSVSRIVR